MNIIENIKKNGLSLRNTNIWMMVFSTIMTILMLYSSCYLASTFSYITSSTEEYISLEKASYDLMKASDYLTEKVQRFALDGDMAYLDEYFTEVLVTKRRENAIEVMTKSPDSADALKQLSEAMEASKHLMEREYYVMKLVIEAKGYKNYPDELKSIVLSETDMALSSEDKMALAARMVLDREYYGQKDTIRVNMEAGLKELEYMIRNKEKQAYGDMNASIKTGRLIIILQCISSLGMVALVTRIMVRPIVNAVERIQHNRTISVTGAREFRYLAQAYNGMFSAYKNSVESLNFKASHDELTGLYNRAGYDHLLSKIDLSSTYMILIDVDDFKTINDTRGHDVGDHMLIRVAQTLSKHFRVEDHVCRIGGDEFAVLMINAGDYQRKLIERKLSQINAELAVIDEVRCCASLSIGIAHGSQADDVTSLFKHADTALYETKEKGKRGYTFYEEKGA